MIAVSAVQLHSRAKMLAAEAFVRRRKGPARTVGGLHLKVGTAMI